MAGVPPSKFTGRPHRHLGTFYCDYCDKELRYSRHQYREHLRGKAHKLNVHRYYSQTCKFLPQRVTTVEVRRHPYTGMPMPTQITKEVPPPPPVHPANYRAAGLPPPVTQNTLKKAGGGYSAGHKRQRVRE